MTVEPEALAEWSAEARRTAASVHTRLAALDHGLAPLVRSWHGAAADGFATRRRQWRDAADGLLDTLEALTTMAGTARANYLAATAANARIWRAEPAVVVHAMAARSRITADLEDIRTAVAGLVAAVDDLEAAWTGLATGLSGTRAMAGGDDPGAAFAVDYDTMAGAAWQGWRSSLLLLDGIAGGLAATGNNLAAAERASTPAPRPFTPITTRTGPAPAPAPPPTAAGHGGIPVVEQLEAYWPTADLAQLRTAAAAWRAAAGGLRGAVQRAFDAVDGLLATNPDPVLQQMRRFTGAALSEDPTSGLVGVLAGTNGRIAAACEGMADLTARTRARLAETVARHADGTQWYDDVADLIDRFVRWRPAHLIAAAGDAYLMELDLATIHDDHVRAVESLRGELHRAGADRLARLATAMVPPTPVPANTCLVEPPDGARGAAVPEAQRQALIGEVVAAGHKIDPAAVVQIARAPDGRVVWLERGTQETGLGHLLRADRIDDFVRVGVTPADIPGLAVRAVVEGTPAGAVGRDAGAYDVDVGGRRARIAVVVGANGYIVSAYPVGTSGEEPDA